MDEERDFQLWMDRRNRERYGQSLTLTQWDVIELRSREGRVWK